VGLLPFFIDGMDVLDLAIDDLGGELEGEDGLDGGGAAGDAGDVPVGAMVRVVAFRIFFPL